MKKSTKFLLKKVNAVILASALLAGTAVTGTMSVYALPSDEKVVYATSQSLLEDTYIDGTLYVYKGLDLNGHTLIVEGDLIFSNGTLYIGGGKLIVKGDLRFQQEKVNDDGSVEYNAANSVINMKNESDYVLVYGDFITQSTYGNGSYYNNLTDGTLELKGDFLQIAESSSNFDAQGNHKVIFSGDGKQTVTFESAGSSGFNILAGTPNTNVDLTSARIRKIGGDVTVGSFVQYGSLDVDGQKLTVTGDMQENGDVKVNGGELDVQGNYHQRSGTFNLENGAVSVGGNYRLQQIETDEDGNTEYVGSDGVLQMDNENDYFKVSGDFITQSTYGNGNYYNNLTDGTLELKGDFLQIAESSSNFDAQGNHKVIFSGDGKQTITFESAGSSGFGILSETTNHDTDLTSARIRKIGGNVTVGNFVQYGSLDVDGQKLTVTGDMQENGNVKVNGGKLNVNGNYLHSGGTFNLENGAVSVDGDYRIQATETDEDGNTEYVGSDGVLQMDNENDYFTVSGSFITQSNYGGGTYYNNLTDGTLELKGDFTQIAGSTYNFNAKGNHKVIFSGNGKQTINFENAGNSGFNILSKTTNYDTDLTSARISKISGDVTVGNFVQYGSLDVDGQKLTVTGDMQENGDVKVNGGELDVNGNYLHSGGTFNLENGAVSVGGNYRLQATETDEDGKTEYIGSDGVLQMDNENDYFTVSGSFITQSNYGGGTYYNNLTDGTLELKGDFTQLAGSAYNFNAQGNHKVIFSGNGKQTINFENAGNSGFNILSKTTNYDTDLTSARISKIGGNVTVGSFVQYGSLDVDGQKLTVTGDMQENGNVKVNGGELNVNGNYLHSGGTFNLENGAVSVDGNYRLQQIETDEDGNTEYIGSDGVLQMDNENDYFKVSGSFITQSTYGNGSYYNNLTDGTLELKGDFKQLAGSAYNFDAQGNHKVIFSGDGKQTINFENAGSSGFNILAGTPNTNVDLTSARIRKIGGDVTVGSFVQYGSLDVDGQKLTVTGDMQENGNVKVNGGELNVGGNYLHSGGTFNLENGTVSVDGDYRIQATETDEDGNTEYIGSDGVLQMDNENDYFTVSGSFITQSNWGGGSYYNNLTDGTLELKGDFKQLAGNTYNFNAQGNHKVIFSGDELQSIFFQNYKNSKFATVVFYKNFDEYLFENGLTYSFLADPSHLLNSSRLSAFKIVCNDSITIKAQGFGGNAPYTYAVLWKNTNTSKWIVHSNYTSKSEFSLKLSEIGTYDVCVKVKDSEGTIEKKYFTVNVFDNQLKNQTVLSSDTVLVGDTLSISGNASGGTAPYTYAVLWKNTNTSKWIVHSNYTSKSEFSLKLSETGTYDICVKVKDSKGTIEKKYFTVNVVNGALKNNTVLSSYVLNAGDTLTINGDSAGGTAPYTYAVLWKNTNTSKWIVHSNYTSKSEFSLKLSEKGTYDVCVKVKDFTGAIEKKYFVVSVG